MKIIESGYHQKEICYFFFWHWEGICQSLQEGNYIGAVVLGTRSGKCYVKSENLDDSNMRDD